MPMYDFCCVECGHEAERITSSTTQVTECPKCGGKMERQLSAPGDFSCKDGGFYKAGANFKTKR